MRRRDAMKIFAGALGAAAWVQPASLPGGDARQGRLGLVVYCLGLQQRLQKQQDPKADLFEPLRFLECCRGLGAGGIQLALGARGEDQLRPLRRKAEQYGMFVEAIVSPPRDQADADRFAAELRTAAGAGAHVARTVVFPGRRYEQFNSATQFREAAQRAKRSLELAAPLAARHRVRLAVENHKDHRVGERVELLKQISSEWIGTCVDTGNNIALLEDPAETVEALAPWAASVHLKDHAVAECEDGFLLADVPLGQGFLDLKKMVEMLRRARPGIPFTLELITRDPLKVPCLTEKYWATLAEAPGRDLARTLRMVRAHARRDLPQVGHLALERQVEIERANVAASLAYARENLGL